MGQIDGLRSNQQNYQQCFIGHSQGASWRETFEQVCEEVLPQFGLTPWYADKQFKGNIPLREKVVNMIATTRYGIYDLSFWRPNDQSAWIMPCNVLIELGMAIALNRPMLLLRHGKNRECCLPLPACLQGIDIGEFGDGKKLLKETLAARLPSLAQHTPQQDWLNRYCHFGDLVCPHREAHPQAQQWGQQKIHIHVADGAHAFQIDCSDFRDLIEEDVINRFNNLDFTYLDNPICPQGCKFLPCSHCQEVRRSPFAIYRITPHTSADTFIAIGMSIALEKQFKYPITKILITDDENTIPSLLKGYEIIVEQIYTRIKDRLNSILPGVIEEVKQATWKPKPLPFEVFLPIKEQVEPEGIASTGADPENDMEEQRDEETLLKQDANNDQVTYQMDAEPTSDEFDKFTERAKKVLSLAQEEAQRLRHNYIGTEHLLLGLVREEEGVAAKVLANLGVELNKVRSAVEFIVGCGDRIVLGEIGLTPRAKKVIELAVDEARRLNHHYIGTEHLLLGLLREGEGIAAGVLEDLGVTLEKARTQTVQVLSPSSANADSDQTRRDKGSSQQQETEGDRDMEQIGRNQVGDVWDRFTESAKKVLFLADEEARRFQNNYIGTEHLLLGLVHEDQGVAAKVLANLGVERNKVRSAVEFIIARGHRIVLGARGLTPRNKKVIDLAINEARRLNHDSIGPEYLLLGLLREGEGIAAGVLASLGVTLEKARTQTVQVLSNASSSFANADKDQAQGNEVRSPQQKTEGEQDVDQIGNKQTHSRLNKFAERARKVLSLAQEEARRFNHNYIGTEHLLLGLVREGDGGAAKVLTNQGVELDKVRSAVEFIIGRGDRIISDELGLTPRAKKVIELAVDEARRLNHHYIFTEHLLLGLLREGNGTGVGALEILGVNLKEAHIQTIQMLNNTSASVIAEPTSGKPIGSRSNQDEVFFNIARGFYRAFKDWRERR